MKNISLQGTFNTRCKKTRFRKSARWKIWCSISVWPNKVGKIWNDSVVFVNTLHRAFLWCSLSSKKKGTTKDKEEKSCSQFATKELVGWSLCSIVYGRRKLRSKCYSTRILHKTTFTTRKYTISVALQNDGSKIHFWISRHLTSFIAHELAFDDNLFHEMQ